MKHDITRQRVDPVLAPDQFSVAQPLAPEDLDRQVTRHGVYPSLPAPTGVPWSEYIRSQRNRSRSVSSSTEALDSDHARYITSRIAQHARSMATGTRSLPTDSPVPYFQPIERGHMSEGGLSDIDSQRAVFSRGIQMSPCTTNVPSGGVKCHPVAAESDGLSTYTGLDDYDTLFEARHGRGALDSVPRTSGEVITTSSIGITPTTLSTGMIVNPMIEVGPTYDGPLHPSQREHVSMSADPSMMGYRVASPSSGHIIGEGAAIFMDMMETMLTALDQQMALSTEAQKSEGSLTDNIGTSGQLTGRHQVGESSIRTQVTHDTKDIYPDLYLPVIENYRISDKFYGYSDSLSTDNNPMVLVELKGLSY